MSNTEIKARTSEAVKDTILGLASNRNSDIIAQQDTAVRSLQLRWTDKQHCERGAEMLLLDTRSTSPDACPNPNTRDRHLSHVS